TPLYIYLFYTDAATPEIYTLSLHDALPICTGVAVAFGNHPAQHGDVGLQILDDGLFIQFDGTASRGALGRSVGQLERLFNRQGVQTFDFQDTAREDVFLAFLLNGQQALLDRIVGDRMDQVTQGDTGLHFALEANQDGFRHVQRHYASGGSKGYQAGTGREGNTDREASVGVAAGTDSVRQQHAVQPGVDHPVTWAQGNTATVHDEVRQVVVHFHVYRLRIGCSVTERLHHQIGGEAKAGQVFQFVTGHGTSGVLRAYSGHLGFAIGARTNAFNATGLTNHFLSQGVAFAAVSWCNWTTEHLGGLQVQCGACF